MPLPDFQGPESNQSRFVSIRRVENQEFTAQECGYIVRMRSNKCFEDKLRCFGVYGGLLPSLGAVVRRA
jgi:hypothetical protein